MTLIRPEVARSLHHWREAIFAGGVLALGLWLIFLGGWLLGALGLVVTGLGAGYLWVAVRRARFLAGDGGPGVVQVDEGRIGYFGPFHGGSAALARLTAIRLRSAPNGRRTWQLEHPDGPSLLIPANAAGADALFDAFATLPGLDPARLVAASRAGGVGERLIWERPAGPSSGGATKVAGALDSARPTSHPERPEES
jgi:hypothetical protein